MILPANLFLAWAGGETGIVVQGDEVLHALAQTSIVQHTGQRREVPAQRLQGFAYKAVQNTEYMQNILIIQCFICKVSLLCTALYAKICI